MYLHNIVLALTISVTLGRHDPRDECSSLRDGVISTWGCRSYTICHGRRTTQVDCHATALVYNPVKKACDNKLNTLAPCGLYRDCQQKQDGRYADLFTNCTAFYTCHGSKFYGHNQCNPGLVFNEQAQICDWSYNVKAPCGTKESPVNPQSQQPQQRNTLRKNSLMRRPIRMRFMKEERETRDIRPLRPRKFLNSDVRPRNALSDDVKPRKYVSNNSDIRPRNVQNKRQRARNQRVAKAVPLVSKMTYKESVHGF